jgi:hypothetical protein
MVPIFKAPARAWWARGDEELPFVIDHTRTPTSLSTFTNVCHTHAMPRHPPPAGSGPDVAVPAGGWRAAHWVGRGGGLPRAARAADRQPIRQPAPDQPAQQRPGASGDWHTD